MFKLSSVMPKAFISVAVGVVLSASALADLTLRSDIRVTGPVVSLGDLFAGAGEFSNKIAAEAPTPGRSLSISASKLETLANKYGLKLELPQYQRAVRVRREGYTLTERDLVGLFQMELGSAMRSGSVVKMHGGRSNLIMSLDADVSDIDVQDLTYNEKSGRFSARLALPAGMGNYIEKTVSGSIEAVRSVPVLARAIAPGDIIREGDIAWIQMPVRSVSNDYITQTASMIGKTVRRGVSADRPIRSRDLQTPVVIEKNRVVGMRFDNGSVSLVAVGRALEDGGAGDMIRVMNVKSKTTITALVVNENMVEVITPQMLARQMADASSIGR